MFDQYQSDKKKKAISFVHGQTYQVYFAFIQPCLRRCMFSERLRAVENYETSISTGIAKAGRESQLQKLSFLTSVPVILPTSGNKH